MDLKVIKVYLTILLRIVTIIPVVSKGIEQIIKDVRDANT